MSAPTEPVQDAGIEPPVVEPDAGTTDDAGMVEPPVVEPDAGVEPSGLEVSVPEAYASGCVATFDEAYTGEHWVGELNDGEQPPLFDAYVGTNYVHKFTFVTTEPITVAKGASFLMENLDDPLEPGLYRLKGVTPDGEWIGIDLQLQDGEPQPFRTTCDKNVERHLELLDETVVYKDGAYQQVDCTLPAGTHALHNNFDFFCNFRDDNDVLFADGHADCQIDLGVLTQCEGVQGTVRLPGNKTSVVYYIAPAGLETQE